MVTWAPTAGKGQGCCSKSSPPFTPDPSRPSLRTGGVGWPGWGGEERQRRWCYSLSVQETPAEERPEPWEQSTGPCL